MTNANGVTRFGVLAREVFSWDAAIGWIALDDPGRRPQLKWRDPDTRLGAVDTTPEVLTVDPLLLCSRRTGVISTAAATAHIPAICGLSYWLTGTARKSSRDSDGTVRSTSVLLRPPMHIGWELGSPDCLTAA
jgi:hypothetical protein